MPTKTKKPAAPRVPKIEIFTSQAPSKSDPLGQRDAYFFRVRASNGEIIAASEGYTRKLDAIKAAETLKRAVTAAKIVEVKA